MVWFKVFKTLWLDPDCLRESIDFTEHIFAKYSKGTG
jgi:hypothetical protein